MSATNDFAQGTNRLGTIARKADPETRRHLEDLGLENGWNCLEIGAGAGSLAQWIATRVAPRGRVLATDLDTKLLEQLREENLEVKRHNIDEEALPAGAFNLVVARYLFEWLQNPAAVLDKIVSSLQPNGWVLLESDVWGALPPPPAGDYAHHEQLQRVRTACFDYLGASPSYHPDIGRQLAGLLEAAGLESVGATGRSVLLRGGTPEVQLYKYEVEVAGAEVVRAGKISADDLAAVLAIYDDPKFVMMSPLTVTAWGRRKG